MSVYKGLLFLDGFRVPAEYVEDVATARPTAARPARPTVERRAAAPASGWRRALRGVATVAGLAPSDGRWG